MSDGREVLAHVALALSRYIKESTREGKRVPVELVTALDFLTNVVRTRQESTRLGDPGDLAHGGAMTTTSLLTKREVAHDLRCSTRTVERLISFGELTSVNVSGGIRVRRSDLDVYVAGLGRSFRERVDVKDSA